MEIYDVVTKLVGKIEPLGETNEDERRYLNLQAMTALVDKLLTDIDYVYYLNKNSQEYSVKRAADYAKKFFDNIGIVK